MRKPLLLVGLAGLPLLGAAQTTPAAPRFYVGAGASLLTSQPFRSYADSEISPALTAGWQFRPRLALQLSGTYTWHNRSHSEAYSNGGSTPPDVYTSETKSKLFTFPLLLRGELTDPAKRLHVDALVGSTLFFSTSRNHYVTTFRGQPALNQTYTYSGASVSLALGPALRYSLTPHVALTADALVHLGLTSAYYSFSNRLISNVLGGVRYQFGG